MEKRKIRPISDRDLYKLSTDALVHLLRRERRQSEIDRLHEVMEQSGVWSVTITTAIAFILLFLTMAALG